MEKRRLQSVETIKEGCVHLANQLSNLNREVRDLSEKLANFKRGRTIPEEIRYHDYPELDRWKGETPQTPEPRRSMADLDFETKDATNLDISTKALMAIGHALDAAVREVRASRHTLQAITDDSDLRAEFKDWQKRH